MTLGGLLVEARRARGVTLEQAANATRIRLGSLAALEQDRAADLPAPVYVRGYLRTYAAYLEVDPRLLLDAYEATLGPSPGGSLALRPLGGLSGAPNVVLTAPAAGAIGLILLAVAFAGYVYRELESVRTPPPAPGVAATALPSPSASPLAALPPPSPTPAVAGVTITVTDTTWIDVAVDGKPQFGDSGKVLDPGASVTFSGVKVKVTTGKGADTIIFLNGRDLGAMGDGVITREYSAQT